MLDTAYALMVEQVERGVTADRQIVSVMLAAGADMPMPNLAEALADLDAALAAPPQRATVIDFEQAQLRKALGVPA